MKKQKYDVYVHLKSESGEVEYAKCNCKAGAGGCCKHVAAALYQIHDFVELGLKTIPDDRTCTDILQQWNVPTTAHYGKIQRFSELCFEKADFEKDRAGSRKRPLVRGLRDYCATPKFAKMVQKEDIERLKDGLKSSGKAPLLWPLLAGNDCQPCTMFSTSATVGQLDNSTVTTVERLDLFKNFKNEPELVTLQPEEATFVDKVLKVSREEAKKIEQQTIGQSSNKKWYQERSKRLTSSNFGLVLNRRESVYPKSILNKVLAVNKTSRIPASCRWGLENEAVALEQYKNKVNEITNNSFNIYHYGLIINPKWPWLACSPDGIIVGCGETTGGIEIKCPFAKKDISVSEACADKTFFMEMNDGKPALKYRHIHFLQCQGVMALCEIEWLDFTVYTVVDSYTQRISFNRDLWDNAMLPKLTHFNFKFVKPELEKHM